MPARRKRLNERSEEYEKKIHPVFGVKDHIFSGWSFVLCLGGALGALGFFVLAAWLRRIGMYRDFAERFAPPEVREETK